MKTIRLTCEHCGNGFDRRLSSFVYHNQKHGNRIFCGLTCKALARRKGKSVAQKKAEKAEYDRQYRVKNKARLKAKKAAFYAANHDREKERACRKKNMHRHVEYCRRPEYRAYKQKYDLVRRSSRFGPFADAHLVLVELEREIRSRMTKQEIYETNGTFNKCQNRKRAYEKTRSKNEQPISS